MKTRIAASLMTIVMALAMMTGTSMAYFSDKAKVTGNLFTSGKIDLRISDGGAFKNSLEGVWSSPKGWVPGGEYSSELTFTNVGSVEAHLLFFRFKGKGDDALMKKIVVTSVVERFNGAALENLAPALALVAGDGDGVLTLSDLVGQAWYTRDDVTGDGVLLAGGNRKDYKLEFAFKFPEDADETYLGLSASFDLECVATQKASTDGFLSFHKKD